MNRVTETCQDRPVGISAHCTIRPGHQGDHYYWSESTETAIRWPLVASIGPDLLTDQQMQALTEEQVADRLFMMGLSKRAAATVAANRRVVVQP